MTVPLHQQLIQTLTERFKPVLIELVDDSHLHAGHAGARDGAHFSLLLVSSAFEGASRLMRHRMVYDALAKWVPGQIHALSIKAYTPQEQS